MKETGDEWVCICVCIVVDGNVSFLDLRVSLYFYCFPPDGSFLYLNPLIPKKKKDARSYFTPPPPPNHLIFNYFETTRNKPNKNFFSIRCGRRGRKLLKCLDNQSIKKKKYKQEKKKKKENQKKKVTFFSFSSLCANQILHVKGNLSVMW